MKGFLSLVFGEKQRTYLAGKERVLSLGESSLSCSGHGGCGTGLVVCSRMLQQHLCAPRRRSRSPSLHSPHLSLSVRPQVPQVSKSSDRSTEESREPVSGQSERQGGSVWVRQSECTIAPRLQLHSALLGQISHWKEDISVVRLQLCPRTVITARICFWKGPGTLCDHDADSRGLGWRYPSPPSSSFSSGQHHLLHHHHYFTDSRSTPKDETTIFAFILSNILQWI